MRWQLLEPHHIDEQVLPAGTIVGDDTQWPFRSTYNDRKIGRKIGDPLPPSRAMTPMDDEARKLFDEVFQGEIPNTDPTRSIPLTGAPDAPRVSGPGSKPPPPKPEPVNRAPDDDGPKTGLAAKPPLSPSTPQPAVKPELQKPRATTPRKTLATRRIPRPPRPPTSRKSEGKMNRIALAFLALIALCASASAQVVTTKAFPEGAFTNNLTASTTGTTGAITATLTGATGKYTYLCGFTVTSAGTTAATLGNITVTGTIGGTMNFTYAFVSSGQGVFGIAFPGCITSSAANTSIVVNVPAGGAGTTVAATAWGYTN